MYMYTELISVITWQSVINSTVKQNNFFIKNKSKYGSATYWYKYMIILLIFMCIAKLLPFFVLPHRSKSQIIANAVVVGIIVLIGLPVLIIIRRKTPRFEDVFMIRVEIKNMLLSVLPGVGFYVLQSVLSPFVSEEANVIIQLTMYFIWCTAFLGVIVIMTVLVVRKINTDTGYAALIDTVSSPVSTGSEHELQRVTSMTMDSKVGKRIRL